MSEDMIRRVSNLIVWMGVAFLVWALGVLALIAYLGTGKGIQWFLFLILCWLLMGGVNYLFTGRMRLFPDRDFSNNGQPEVLPLGNVSTGFSRRQARKEVLELKNLLDEGVLTQEEYDAKANELKKKIL